MPDVVFFLEHVRLSFLVCDGDQLTSGFDPGMYTTTAKVRIVKLDAFIVIDTYKRGVYIVLEANVTVAQVAGVHMLHRNYIPVNAQKNQDRVSFVE